MYTSQSLLEHHFYICAGGIIYQRNQITKHPHQQECRLISIFSILNAKEGLTCLCQLGQLTVELPVLPVGHYQIALEAGQHAHQHLDDLHEHEHHHVDVRSGGRSTVLVVQRWWRLDYADAVPLMLLRFFHFQTAVLPGHLAATGIVYRMQHLLCLALKNAA